MEDSDLSRNMMDVGSLRTLSHPLVPYFTGRLDAMEVIKNQCLFLAFAVRHMVQARGKVCKIGFVGCGQLGTFVLESLAKEGWPMDNVIVCTRSSYTAPKIFPDSPHHTDDVMNVTSSSHILFVMVMPSQLKQIATTIGKKLKKRTIVVSVVAGVSASKLDQLFPNSHTIRTIVDTRDLMAGMPSLGPAPTHSTPEVEKEVETHTVPLPAAVTSEQGPEHPLTDPTVNPKLFFGTFVSTSHALKKSLLQETHLKRLLQASAHYFDSVVVGRIVAALATQQEFLGASYHDGEREARRLLNDEFPPQVITTAPTKHCIEDLWITFSANMRIAGKK